MFGHANFHTIWHHLGIVCQNEVLQPGLRVKPYISTLESNTPQNHGAWFGIKLGAISRRWLSESRERDYAAWMLNSQIDFIATLPALGQNNAIELRFSSRPEAGSTVHGHVDVLLRVRVDGETADAARLIAAETFNGLWPNLVSISDSYEWSPLETEADYRAAFCESTPTHFAELVRREALIAFDRADLFQKERSIGFSAQSSNTTITEDSSAAAYLCFPFVRSFGTLERMFKILLMQSAPVIVSISLTPAQLRAEELDALLAQMEQCERYLQLPMSGPVSRPAEFLPPYRTKAGKVLEMLQRASFTLRDDSLMLKIQVGSQQAIPAALMEALGVTITEHVSSTDTDADTGREPIALAGGYDWQRAETADEKCIALHNLNHVDCASWVKTLAPPHAERLRYMMGAPEANSAFRFPVPIEMQFPGVETRLARTVSLPANLPSSGLFLGNNFHGGARQPVNLHSEDRRRHTYVVGQTGTGKSSLLLSMIMQDIRDGKGVAVLDPHGELVEAILSRIPEQRVADVIHINPEDTDAVVGLNLLDYRDEVDRDSAINHLLEIFDKLYNMSEVGGPVFENYLRNSALLVTSDPAQPASLGDILRVFTDRAFLEDRLRQCKDVMVTSFWRDIVFKMQSRENSLADMGAYVTSKFTRLTYNRVVRNIVLQRKSTVDFLDVMNSGKIVLVDLCKGRLGETNSAFLGMVLTSLIQRAAFARGRSGKASTSRDFYLYLDEFQNLATEGIGSMLSEARKYGLNLVLANQYLHQIPEAVRDAVFGNVGTFISFRIGRKDAELLEDEYLPIVNANDLTGLPNYHAYVRTLVKGETTRPFSLRTQLDPDEENASRLEQIKAQMKKYTVSTTEVERALLMQWSSKNEATDK